MTVLWIGWLAARAGLNSDWLQSVTARFARTDVAAHIALSALEPGTRGSVDSWIDRPDLGRGLGDHHYGEDSSAMISNDSSVTFWLAAYDGARTAATAVVHDLRAIQIALPVKTTVHRAVVDTATDAILRVHTDMTLDGGATVRPDELDDRLRAETSHSGPLAVVDVRLGPGRRHRPLRFDRQLGIVVETPPPQP